VPERAERGAPVPGDAVARAWPWLLWVAMATGGRRRVSYEKAKAFLARCRARPDRMRLLCSTKAGREGGDELLVSVEVAPGGPVVEVQEISMADGWTGCRFSPSALWLAVALAREGAEAVRALPAADGGDRAPRALELGCGVALAGLTAHALGFRTTLTDCLPGHLRSLQEHEATVAKKTANGLRVRYLDWLEEDGPALSPAGPAVEAGGCHIDRGSPENRSSAGSQWPRLVPEEQCTFDLVLASDILYEEHHAVLLPAVLAKWLRPGGQWALCLAIRDAAMLMRFLQGMQSKGLLEVCRWETACLPERCPFCKEHVDSRVDRGSLFDLHRGGLPLHPLEFLRKLVEGHEGGAILLSGQRPSG